MLLRLNLPALDHEVLARLHVGSDALRDRLDLLMGHVGAGDVSVLELIGKALDYYKEQEAAAGGRFFEHQMLSEERAFYKGLLGFAWTWARLIVLQHAGFSLEQYEKELSAFTDSVELEHHQQQQCSTEAVEFTLNALRYVQKFLKKDAPCFPLNYVLHQSLLALDEAQDDPELQRFAVKTLNVKTAFQLLHRVKHVFVRELQGQSDFAHYSEQQNAALYKLKALLGRLARDFGGLLRQSPLSVELVAALELGDDFLEHRASRKLLAQVSNAWLLSDICREVFSVLEGYEVNFGPCHGKLRLMLDLGAVCHRLSFVFVSDGSFQQRLKSDVLAKAGERACLAVMNANHFEPPFALTRSDVCVVDVAERFAEHLRREADTYRKVWDTHLDADDGGALFHLSRKMAQVLEDDLREKLDELDFDKDPH